MSDLSDALRVSDESGVRELTIKIKQGEKPEVKFNGFWNGKFIQAAMSSIAKAYRIQARNIVRPRAIPNIIEEKKTQPVVVEKGGKGDGVK